MKIKLKVLHDEIKIPVFPIDIIEYDEMGRENRIISFWEDGEIDIRFSVTETPSPFYPSKDFMDGEVFDLKNPKVFDRVFKFFYELGRKSDQHE